MVTIARPQNSCLYQATWLHLLLNQQLSMQIVDVVESISEYLTCFAISMAQLLLSGAVVKSWFVRLVYWISSQTTINIGSDSILARSIQQNLIKKHSTGVLT